VRLSPALAIPATQRTACRAKDQRIDFRSILLARRSTMESAGAPAHRSKFGTRILLELPSFHQFNASACLWPLLFIGFLQRLRLSFCLITRGRMDRQLGRNTSGSTLLFYPGHRCHGIDSLSAPPCPSVFWLGRTRLEIAKAAKVCDFVLLALLEGNSEPWLRLQRKTKGTRNFC